MAGYERKDSGITIIEIPAEVAQRDAKIFFMNRQGYSLREIGREVRASPETVRRVLIRGENPDRPEHALKAEINKWANDLARDTLLVAQDALGVMMTKLEGARAIELGTIFGILVDKLQKLRGEPDFVQENRDRRVPRTPEELRDMLGEAQKLLGHLAEPPTSKGPVN